MCWAEFSQIQPYSPSSTVQGDAVTSSDRLDDVALPWKRRAGSRLMYPNTAGQVRSHQLRAGGRL